MVSLSIILPPLSARMELSLTMDESFIDACPLEVFIAVKSDLLTVFILAHQDANEPEFKTMYHQQAGQEKA